jgi:DnaJ-class molecular chaperone
MSESKKYSRCPKCYGTGICNTYNAITEETTVEDPCVNCSGQGYFEDGKIDTTEIMDKLDWLKKKVKKILDKLEVPE